jgi:hypothetical protein
MVLAVFLLDNSFIIKTFKISVPFITGKIWIINSLNKNFADKALTPLIVKKSSCLIKQNYFDSPQIMPKPKLLDQVRNLMRMRHLSHKTEDAYEDAYYNFIKRYIFFHNKRHPAEMDVEEISAFLTHLAVNEKVFASTQNQALFALLFL